jgi:DNA-directed RNA polymerase beta subunit
VNVEKNASTAAGPIVASESSGHEKTHLRYTSDSYQKILDYHVGEILLTTIIFGVILLLRLHHFVHLNQIPR